MKNQRLTPDGCCSFVLYCLHVMNLNWISLTNFINTSFFLSLSSLSLQSVCVQWTSVFLSACRWAYDQKSTALAALLTMSYSVEGSAANPYQPSGGMQTMMVQTQSPVLPQQQSPAAIVTLPPDFNLQQGQGGQDQGKLSSFFNSKFSLFFIDLVASFSLIYSTDS